MKTQRRVLAILLTLCTVIGLLPGICLVSWADEAENTEINLAPKYAKSMIMFTRGDKADGKKEFTDGVIDDDYNGYWTLGGGPAHWTDDTDSTDADGNLNGAPKAIEDNPCVVEAEMKDTMTITAISAGFYTNGSYTHWVAYASNDNTLPIAEWTKIAEKTTNEVEDGNGFKVAVEGGSIDAKYIRLYGTYNNKLSQIRLNELEIWGPEPAKPTPVRRNLAPDSVISKADGVNVTKDLANGLVDNEPGGDYWSAYGYDCIEDPIANDSGAWFSVDLGGIYNVDTVKVFERIASGSVLLDYYTNWEVYGTTDDSKPLTEWTKLGEKKTEEKVRAEGYATEFEATAVRYLRIYGTKTTSTASDYFQLCEIEVWGIEADVPTNLAPDSVISKADGVNVTKDLANGLIDNEPGGDYWSAYGYNCIEDPIANDSGAWFSVDLGDIYAVNMVKVFERVASGSDLLDYYTNWEVYGALDDDTPLTEWIKLGEKKTEDKVRPEGYATEFAPTAVRYLRIYGTKTTSTASDYFQLCEIEVWGVPSDVLPPEKPVLPTEEDVPTPEGAINRAQGEGVVISKADGVDITSDLADGKTTLDNSDGYWSAYGYGCNPNPIENNSGAWFSVDLGAVYTVDAITVIGRIGDYFHHFEIYGTGDEDAALEGWDKLGEKTTDEMISIHGYTVSLAEATQIRYLRVYGTKTTSKMSKDLQLCEIEVWDYNPNDFTAPEGPGEEDDKPSEVPTLPPAVSGDEVDPDENKAPSTDTTPDTDPTPDTTDTENDGGSNVGLIIAIAVAVLALIGVGAWFATKKKK